jgi:cytoskeletal protein CcmA (bactofilin family)
LKADQGDDNADQHKLNIADGGVLTLGSKISGSFVSYLTHTPNATVADSTTAVAGNLTVGGDLTLGSGAVITEAELEAIDGVTAGTVAASKAVIVDSNKDIASFRNVTLTGELDAGSLDISGDADIDGTLEADARTLNGTAITATATLDTGISNNNVPKFTSGVADNDFLRVDGTAIEGRSAAEVLSDIGGQAALTFGISNTNAVKIDSSSVADDEYARFTANGLESRSTSEVLSDIGAAPAAGDSNIVTTGALNSGSITSGFGAIDNGSSNITTTGVGSFGSLDISGDIDVDGTTNLDNVDIDGTASIAGHASIGVDAVNSNRALTVAGASDGSSSSILVCYNSSLASKFSVRDDGLVTVTGDLVVNGTALATTDTDTSNTGSVTLDFGANQNFVLTLTGNVTLANPSTEQVGQSGFIVFIQDGTGSRTVSLGTDYETASGAGLTLSSAASTTDIVPYVVAASGRVLLGNPQLAFS